jgi:hypothetical protein
MTSIFASVDTAVDVLREVVINRKSNKHHSYDTCPNPLKVETFLSWAMAAIQANEGFLQEGIIDATEVMLNKPSVIELYLLIEDTGTCSIFLLNQMKKLKKYN